MIKEFDPVWYLNEYSDVRDSGLDPLFHYENFGRAEGRYSNAQSADPSRYAYANWLDANNKLSNKEIDLIKAAILNMGDGLKFSIIMPVYRTNLDFLRKAIDSVRSQLYKNWELCISDDFSDNDQIESLLSHYESLDSRIKIVYRRENGNICASTNSALEIATGDWMGFMDHDDMIEPHTLFLIACKIKAEKNLKLVYTDEDKIDELDKRFDPYFKSSWDPFLILQQNYIAHMTFIESTLVKKLGGLRVGYEGSQDYDLILRAISDIDDAQIGHVPFVLYHWRKCDGHHSFSNKYQSRSDDSARKSLEAFYRKNGNTNAIIPKLGAVGMWEIPQNKVNKFKFSIIIPTRDKVELLRVCVDSILEKSEYNNFEINIVDNGSIDPATFDYYNSIDHLKQVKVLSCPIDFNYSALNNYGIKNSTGDCFILLNNDTEVIEPQWMNRLASIMDDNRVGAVGAKLLYSDGKIQHAGVALGIYGVAGHPFKNINSDSNFHFNYPNLTRCVSAVTGACLAVKRTVLELIGLLDESLAVSYNDVDLCLRIRLAGFLILYEPNVLLYHYESKSRGFDDTPSKKKLNAKESRYFIKKHGNILLNDPYYNLNLTIFREDFSISYQPRAMKPWVDVVEVVVPFHRGDVLIAIQVCKVANRNGVSTRLHVCEEYLELVAGISPDISVSPIPFSPPHATEIPKFFNKCMNYVRKLEDFSGKIVSMHSDIDWKAKGLSLHSSLFYQMGLDIDLDGPLFEFESEYSELSATYDVQNSILLFPKAGWDLKSVPIHLIGFILFQAHKLGLTVIQVGGPSDTKIKGLDGYILQNLEPAEWIKIFRSSCGLISCDSWAQHMASGVDIPYCVIYGPTNPATISSDSLFSDKKHFVHNVGPYSDCSPCDSFTCRINGSTLCQQYSEPNSKIYLELAYFLCATKRAKRFNKLSKTDLFHNFI